MKLLLLGASGNIGYQTLNVIKSNQNNFELDGMSVGKNTRCITSIIKSNSSIKHICIQRKSSYNYYKNKYKNINFYYGNKGLEEIVVNSSADMVVNALVGFVGLLPTVRALENNKIVALANKESLVVGGEIVNKLLKEGKGKIYPIDSEHVAISKCLKVDNKNVKKLILTASGGAFRKLSRLELNNVTVNDALNHPTWNMGKKITIDSATMVNKCFEIIEAHYLFNYPYNKIDVILHDESYVHSLVEYKNKTLRAEVSKPDMRNPIKYALFETNIEFETQLVSTLDDFKEYHFHEFDIDRFPIVNIAKEVIQKGGYKGVILNAANEEAVYAFLNNKIPFVEIENIIYSFMNKYRNRKNPTLENIIKMDKKVRKDVRKYIANY